MQKTTVYLPEDLKQALAHAAAVSGRSEADLIREGVRSVTRGAARPRPRGGLFDSGGDGSLSARVDELLAGFGEH
jgi:hypothetical protein